MYCFSRRIISAVLLACFIFIHTVVFAESVNIEENINNDVINALNAFGILKSDWQSEETVTRAEAASILIRMMGFDTSTENDDEKSVFSDVYGNRAQTDIDMAYQLGLVSGYRDGTFKPDQTVSYEQIIKMFVSALGYGQMAKEKGGYPVGYNIIATEKGIMKKLDVNPSADAKKGYVAQMIYNALDVDMIQQVSFGDERKFKQEKNKTLLSEKLKINKKKGIITATHKTALTGDSDVQEDEIELQDEVYKNNCKKAEEYLGYNVTVYYKEDDEKVIIHIESDHNQNDVISIEADNIDKDATTKNKFKYRENEDENSDVKEIEISPFVDVIYNGRFLPSNREKYTTSGYLKPASGYITFLDNNHDGEMDVIFVTEYRNIFVSGVSFIYKTVTDEYMGETLELDESKKNKYEFMIREDNNEIALMRIKNSNIVSVAESDDKKVKAVFLSAKKLEGAITEIDEENKAVCVDNKKYKLAENYIQACKNDKAEKIELGKQGIFYLDIENKIAAFKEDYHKIPKYGYLVGGQCKPGLGDKCWFKIFASSGDFITVDSAKSIKYNNEKDYSGRDILKIDALKEADKFKDQLITYSLNKENEICELNTAVSGKDLDKFSADAYFSKDNPVAFRTKPEGFIVDVAKNVYLMNDSTVIFNIPQDLSDQEGFSVESSKILINSEKYQDFFVYDLDDMDMAKVVLFKNTVGGQNYVYNINKSLVGDYCGVVSNVTEIWGGDGEEEIKISLYYRGSLRNYIVTDSLKSTVRKLEKGDIITFSLNTKEEVRAIMILFTLDVNKVSDWTIQYNKEDKNGIIKDIYDKFVSGIYDRLDYKQTNTLYGKLLKKQSGMMASSTTTDCTYLKMLANGIEDVSIASFNLYKTNYYIMDITNPANIRVKLGSKFDLSEGSKIFVKRSKFKAYDVVIFKE